MKDDEFNELKIQASVCPDKVRWPNEFLHWQRLHGAADEARSRVSKTFAQLDEVDANGDLTPEGKTKARTKIAEKALSDLRQSTALENARTAVSRMQQRWAAKIDEAIKPAEDHGMAVVHAQIRDRVSSMDQKARLVFVDKNIDNPTVIAAVLGAPEFLSGLSPVEVAVIKQKLAQRVLSPEVSEAAALTEQAMASTERGWRRAAEMISERAGLKPIRAVKAA